MSGTALTGVGSTFRADVSVGDDLFFNSKYCVVETVTSDTALVVKSAADKANTGYVLVEQDQHLVNQHQT